MDFESMDTPEMAAFRQEVRNFLKEIIPKELVISADPIKNTDEQYEMRRQINRKLGAKGWSCATMPKEYGGGGLTMEHAIVIDEEMDEYGLSVSGPGLGGPSILVWGTEEQKKRFLPGVFTGQVRMPILLTEPHGGSDLASTKTTAIREGDEYII